MSSIKKGIIWTSGEKLLTQLVQFILGIIIARLITPQEYGVLGIIMVFINIAYVFVESGLGSALIYRNDLDKKDIQTTFSFNFIVSLLLCCLLYVVSPFLEKYFNLNGLSLYLRVASWILIFNSFVIVPTCILKIKQNFKAISLTNFLSTLISGIIGVIMAYRGYGVWSLIFQLLIKSILSMLFFTFQSRWLPKFSFYHESFTGLWQYSVNILTLSSITKFVEEGISFIIGKSLTPYSLGLFTRGLQFSSLPNSVISSVLSTVMFPAFSSCKEDKVSFYNLYRKAILVQAIFIPPIHIGLAIISEPLIYLLLGDKWMGVVPVLQVLCIGKIIFSLANTTENVLYSLGYSNLSLKQQIYKMLVKLILVLFAIRWGLMAVVIANALADFSAYFITNYCGSNHLSYSINKQLSEIKNFIVFAIIAGGCAYLLGSLFCNPFFCIIIVIIVFLFLYVVLLMIFEKEKLLKLYSWNL